MEPRSPATVRAAGYLVFCGIGVQIVGLVALFYWHDAIRKGIEREHPSWGSTRISAEVMTHQAGAAVFVVLLIVFWLWVADRLQAAWTQAPAVATALATVGAGGSLQMTLDAAFPWGAKVGTMVGAVFWLVAAALLWAPASTSFFGGGGQRPPPRTAGHTT